MKMKKFDNVPGISGRRAFIFEFQYLAASFTAFPWETFENAPYIDSGLSIRPESNISLIASILVFRYSKVILAAWVRTYLIHEVVYSKDLFERTYFQCWNIA